MISFRREGTPQAGLVVVGLRDAPLLLDCLKSVAENVRGITYEVIVVLNDPTPRLCAELEGNISGAYVYPFRANTGFGAAVNYGASRARSQYLALLNDDCVVEPGWVESLIDTTTRHPHCGLVGSRVFNSDCTLQEAGAIVWSDGTTSTVCDSEHAEFIEQERSVDYCGGEALLIRSDLWKQLGGFDDRYYPAYYEDVDLSFRAFEAGWETWYQPRAVVCHARNASTTASERAFFVDRSRQRFVDRWRDRLQDQEAPGNMSSAISRAMDRQRGEPVVEMDGADPTGDPSEREEVHDIEIEALRRELEIRFAYGADLEGKFHEREQHVDWLYRHIEQLTVTFEAEQRRAAEELDAERRSAAEARASLQSAEDLLAAERARRSYVMVQRMVAARGWMRRRIRRS